MAPHDSPPFSELLRRHRFAAGLSQEALAEETGLSVDAIGLLERGERQRPQRHTLHVLVDALALDEEDRGRFLEAARSPARGVSHQAISGSPHQTTPILGRDFEIEMLTALLRGSSRLLTLTGPGGVGKTRLAHEVAEHIAGSFDDSVTFVPLAPLADPSLVMSAIAAALGVKEETAGIPWVTLQSSVEAALAGRDMLLILDNFEHVIEAAPLTAALIAAAPRLRLLVTSRIALRIGGEREFPVQPLPVPGVGTISDLAHNPAVALFAQRVEAVQPSFTLTPSVARTVAEICRRVDGLPLAIELVAGRAKILSPKDLLARLDRGMAVLSAGRRDAPARHQSLHATLTWSHDLLGTNEKVLFRRLAVFTGGWTVEAAEAVCAGGGLAEDAVLDGLGTLADHSLVALRDWDGAHPRIEMLETIRAYAREKLEEAGEWDALRRRHAIHYLDLAEQPSSGLRGQGASKPWTLLDREYDNLRAALRWADQCRDWVLGLRLAAALARFWFIRGYYAEGRAWLERFLIGVSDAEPNDSTLDAVRARALEGLAALVYNLGDYARAAALFEQSIELYRQRDDRQAVARGLTDLGGVLRDWGDRARSIALLEESLEQYRSLDDRSGVAHALVNLGSAVALAGDLSRAEPLLVESVELYRDLEDEADLVYSLRMLGQLLAERGLTEHAATVVEESLTLSRTIGDRGGTGAALNLLGHIMRERGDLDRAEALLKEALSIVRAAVKVGVAYTLEGLAGVEAERGRMHRAARLLGAAAAFRAATGVSPRSYLAGHTEADREAVRVALEEEAFAVEWEAGGHMTDDRIIAFALGEEA